MEKMGLWEDCVGSSGIVSSAVWEKVGLWEGCKGISGNVSSTVW